MPEVRRRKAKVEGKNDPWLKEKNRYGTTNEEEIAWSNKVMAPMYEARRKYEAAQKRKKK
jgi:hypothetical protein